MGKGSNLFGKVNNLFRKPCQVSAQTSHFPANLRAFPGGTRSLFGENSHQTPAPGALSAGSGKKAEIGEDQHRGSGAPKTPESVWLDVNRTQCLAQSYGLVGVFVWVNNTARLGILRGALRMYFGLRTSSCRIPLVGSINSI